MVVLLPLVTLGVAKCCGGVAVGGCCACGVLSATGKGAAAGSPEPCREKAGCSRADVSASSHSADPASRARPSKGPKASIAHASLRRASCGESMHGTQCRECERLCLGKLLVCLSCGKHGKSFGCMLRGKHCKGVLKEDKTHK